MPCRPKLCQRFAAQLSNPPPGSNHIWISDELLAEAFNRYVRVSHATRRYGSNVPGPLEARRRATKRRMGMAVVGAAMGPPGGDFGALFGAGAGQPSGQYGWSWTAPGTRSDPPALAKKPSDPWSWSTKPSNKRLKYEQILEKPKTARELVIESCNAFDKVLKERENIKRLQKADVTAICDFLSSSADEPAARNTAKFFTWLLDRSVSHSAWQDITALICDKIQLASIGNEELVQVIKVLPEAFDWQNDQDAHQQLHDIYAAFSASLLDDARAIKSHQAVFEGMCKITQNAQACPDLIDRLIMLSKITACANTSSENISSTLLAISRHGGEDESRAELLSRLASVLDEVPTEIAAEVLGLSTRFIVDNRRAGGFARAHALNWLKCLSAYQSLGRSPLDMKIVYAGLAKVLRPSQVAEHIATLHEEPEDTIRLLLDTWLPNMDLAKLQSDYREKRNASSGRKGKETLKTLQFSLHDLSVADLPFVADEFERLRALGERPAWTDFLRAFVRTGFEYEAIAHEVLGLCKAKYSVPDLYWIFHSQLKSPELVLPSSAAVSLIKHFLAAKKPGYAFGLFRQVLSVAITDVPELPIALLEQNASTRNVFEILLRQPNKIPMECREVHKLDVTPKHIEVVHLLAYDIANASVLSPLQAYRSAWACYRWLQDRGAPLKPLISRAIVTAGILRPLQELLWIPDQRLDYVLSIVEKVEGPENRDQVEILARRMRKARHEGVLSKRRAKFQTSWMKGTHMRANETRYSVKMWTRKKPLPSEDGKSYHVPSVQDAYVSSAPTPPPREDVVQEGRADAFSQGELVRSDSTFSEVRELEGWWRSEQASIVPPAEDTYTSRAPSPRGGYLARESYADPLPQREHTTDGVVSASGNAKQRWCPDGE
jgi:hypothetical protein